MLVKSSSSDVWLLSNYLPTSPPHPILLLTTSPIQPVDVIIEFEGSARWPDSLPAIQRTKIAFLLKLGDLLSASDSTIATRVGLENDSGPASQYTNTSFLDIVLPSPSHGLTSPIAFRVRIHHDRTQTLLQKTLSTASLPPHSRAALTRTLQAYTRDNITTPLHTTTISRLCTLYPTLPTSIHLLKSWTSSHHLLHSLPEPILELLSALPYLQPFPYTSPPSNPQNALLRTLSFLATWDWTSDPLILDLSGTTTTLTTNAELPPTKIANLRTRFHAWRHTLDPALNNVIWFIGTNIDETGVAWTQGTQPSRVVAARVTALARASMEVVRQRGADGMATVEDWKRLFRSPVGDFDFVIHLKKRSNGVSRREGQAEGEDGYKNLQLQLQLQGGQDEPPLQVGFPPTALYLSDLESCFGPHVLFFHGGGDSRVIAGLWNPKVLERRGPGGEGREGREWRVRMGYSTVPVLGGREDGDGEGEGQEEAVGRHEKEGGTTVEGVVNQRGMLAEMEMLGQGLVERVEVLRELVV